MKELLGALLANVFLGSRKAKRKTDGIWASWGITTHLFKKNLAYG